MIPSTSLPSVTSSERGAAALDLNRILPENKPVEVKVVNSRPAPDQSGNQRLTLQVGNQTVQVDSKQSIPAGTTLEAVRQRNGNVELRPATSTSTNNTSSSSSNSPPITARPVSVITDKVQLQPVTSSGQPVSIERPTTGTVTSSRPLSTGQAQPISAQMQPSAPVARTTSGQTLVQLASQLASQLTGQPSARPQVQPQPSAQVNGTASASQIPSSQIATAKATTPATGSVLQTGTPINQPASSTTSQVSNPVQTQTSVNAPPASAPQSTTAQAPSGNPQAAPAQSGNATSSSSQTPTINPGNMLQASTSTQPRGQTQAAPSPSSAGNNLSNGNNSPQPMPAAPAVKLSTTNANSVSVQSSTVQAPGLQPQPTTNTRLQSQQVSQTQPSTSPVSMPPSAAPPSNTPGKPTSLPSSVTSAQTATSNQLHSMSTTAGPAAQSSPQGTTVHVQREVATTTQTNTPPLAAKTLANTVASTPTAPNTQPAGSQPTAQMKSELQTPSPQPSRVVNGARSSNTAASTSSTTGNQPQSHLVSVRLADGITQSFNSPRSISPGTRLLITPQPGGNIQAQALPPPSTSPLTSTEQSQISDRLRQTMPQQIPTGDAFSALQQLASSQPDNAKGNVNNAVRSLLNLFGVSPGTEDTAKQIRQNVEQGGRMTEARAMMGKSLTGDMKQALKQLKQLSDQLPVQAREQLDQLVQKLQARHTSQQLTALQQRRESPDGTMERVLRTDIPVRQGEEFDNVELVIKEEQQSDNVDGRFSTQWRVQLQFDLERKGHIMAELVLGQDEQLSGSFWVERRETAAEIRNRLSKFVNHLDEQGFDVQELHCHLGRPPSEKDNITKQLVDLKT